MAVKAGEGGSGTDVGTSTITIHFDGAAEPNPGQASWGAVLSGGPLGHPVELSGAMEGRRTNNEAEYEALESALKALRDNPDHGATAIEIFGDSQLVVNQVNKKWACNVPHLGEARDRCRALLDGLGIAWTLAWISREQNVEADRLSVAAWTQKTGKPFPPPRPKKPR